MSSVNANGVPQTATRRERVRAATVNEIKQVARRLLVEDGPQNVTLRAIAREMGMTAPGLYRYFPSYDDLFAELVSDVYGELADLLNSVRDATPDPDSVARLVAVARAFRSWACKNPREFGLVFGTPSPPSAVTMELALPTGPSGNGVYFGNVFAEIFLTMWFDHSFPIPPENALNAALVEQLRRYREDLVATYGQRMASVPLGALHVFLRCWVQLYGMVAMEVYAHLAFCFMDAEPFFEAILLEMAELLGGTVSIARRS